MHFAARSLPSISLLLSASACGTANDSTDNALESDPDALIAADSKDYHATLTTARFGALVHDAASWQRMTYENGNAVFSSVAISGENVTASLKNYETPDQPFQTNFTITPGNAGNEFAMVLSSSLKAGSVTAIRPGNLTLTAMRRATRVSVGLTASPTFAASLFGRAKLKSVLTDLQGAVGLWLSADGVSVGPKSQDAGAPKADAGAPKADAAVADAGT